MRLRALVQQCPAKMEQNTNTYPSPPPYPLPLLPLPPLPSALLNQLLATLKNDNIVSVDSFRKWFDTPEVREDTALRTDAFGFISSLPRSKSSDEDDDDFD